MVLKSSIFIFSKKSLFSMRASYTQFNSIHYLLLHQRKSIGSQVLTGIDVTQINGHIFVTVWTLVFVVEAKNVQQLVDDNTW
jgi:hypothetical protein